MADESQEEPVTAEQAAALNRSLDEEGDSEGEPQAEDHPQEGSDSTMFDTEQHSDAPGPFGTS